MIHSDMAFSFLRPYWLTLLLLVPLVAWLLHRHWQDGGWARYVRRENLPWLLSRASGHSRHWRLLVPLLLLIAVIALAGPSWRSIPGAGLKNRHAMVLAIDLSESMLASDLRPSRLARARLKIADLLRQRGDGESALIAYAGDAFRVAPLTDDPQTIINLLPTLHPDIMPAPGSQVEAAVKLAQQLIASAGLTGGDLVVITDGIDKSARQWMLANIDDSIRLSVLAVAGDDAVTIPTTSGTALRGADGQPVTVRTDHQALRRLAAQLGGSYAQITSDNSDVAGIADSMRNDLVADRHSGPDQFDNRYDEGGLLVVLLLPVVLLAFRRNLLWLVLVAMPWPQTGYAEGWSDWWLSADQQAARLLANGQAAQARTRFTDPRWRAVADYRAQHYSEAALQFLELGGTANLYNHANALALSGNLGGAVHAYGAVLLRNPNHEKARHNRKLVLQLLASLREQEQQNKQRQGSSDDDSPPGNQDRPDGTSQTAPQVGGSSRDGQTQSQGPVVDSGAASQQARADRSDDSDPGEETSAPPTQAQKQPARPQSGNNATLNPYSEQWLRNLKADPGYMMRRKFQHQASQRARQTSTRQPGQAHRY